MIKPAISLISKPALRALGEIGSIGRRAWPKKPVRLLGVVHCYNEADIIGDTIDHLLANRHDVMVWDHGSEDGTAKVLDRYDNVLLERKFVPRSFDFDNLHRLISRYLIKHYARRYDWISWPDADEILEGPDRRKPYYEYLYDAYYSRYNFIEFNNFNYWYTEEDDPLVVSPTRRIRRYSLRPDCAPRIRSWRASVTNIRWFNHNPLRGEKYPVNFNMRHYPIRSRPQMENRLYKDRAGLVRGKDETHFHYQNMRMNLGRIVVRAGQLHYDDGLSELDHHVAYDWSEIYGRPAGTPLL